MYLDGLQGVVRTRRIEFASAAEEWSQGDLISADQDAEQSRGEVRRGRGYCLIVAQVVGPPVGRGSRSSSAVASEGKSAVAAELRG
jgi:hypothetical protein